jgi:hypothetical protein
MGIRATELRGGGGFEVVGSQELLHPNTVRSVEALARLKPHIDAPNGSVDRRGIVSLVNSRSLPPGSGPGKKT